MDVGFYKGTKAGTAVQTSTNSQLFGTVDALLNNTVFMTVLYAKQGILYSSKGLEVKKTESV